MYLLGTLAQNFNLIWNNFSKCRTKLNKKQIKQQQQQQQNLSSEKRFSNYRYAIRLVKKNLVIRFGCFSFQTYIFN